MMPDNINEDELSFLIDEESVEFDDSDSDEDDEDGDSDGRGGKKSDDTRKKKPDPKELRKLLEEEELEVSDEWAEKMRLLALGPFSSIIPGASAFDAESDLKKKIFIGEVGVITHQIQPSDVADPNLIENLQARLVLRQDEMREIAATMIRQAGIVTGITNAALSIGSDLRQDIKTQTTTAKVDENIDKDDRAVTAKREDVVKIEEEKPESKKKNEFGTTISTIIEKDKSLIDFDGFDILDKKGDDKFSVANQIESQDSAASKFQTTKTPTGDIKLQDTFNQSATQTVVQTQAVPLKQEVNFTINDPSAVLRPQIDQFKI
jgi:hypothetical protein